MGINEVDMISDNWLCFILMGHLFMHFLCGFDLIKTRKKDTQQLWGKWSSILNIVHSFDGTLTLLFATLQT